MILDGIICHLVIIHLGRVILYVWSNPPVRPQLAIKPVGTTSFKMRDR